MSVRAYITREKKIWVNEDRGFFQYNNDGENLTKYVHTDHEYCINIWHQDELIEDILNFGGEDYTNSDFVGEIEIGKEDFLMMVEHNKRMFSREDIESIKKICDYFAEGHDWLVLTCY